MYQSTGHPQLLYEAEFQSPAASGCNEIDSGSGDCGSGSGEPGSGSGERGSGSGEPGSGSGEASNPNSQCLGAPLFITV